MKTILKIVLVYVSCLLIACTTAKAEIVIGVEPGQPYSAELTEKLPQDVQAHIWHLANVHGFSRKETLLYYAAMIGLAEAESEFKFTAYNDKNSNGTVDRGLYQINSAKIPELKKAGLLSTYKDLYDPYISATCADRIFYDCWQKSGYSEMVYSRYLYGKKHDLNKYTARAWAIIEKWKGKLCE